MKSEALDYPRRCFMCGEKIYECMGFVLARDILPIMRAALEGKKYTYSRKVRELCWRCVFVWDSIAERMEGINHA